MLVWGRAGAWWVVAHECVKELKAHMCVRELKSVCKSLTQAPRWHRCWGCCSRDDERRRRRASRRARRRPETELCNSSQGLRALHKRACGGYGPVDAESSVGSDLEIGPCAPRTGLCADPETDEYIPSHPASYGPYAALFGSMSESSRILAGGQSALQLLEQLNGAAAVPVMGVGMPTGTTDGARIR